MAGLTRDRGCLYYVPWICLQGFAVLIIGVGLWIHFGLEVYNDTRTALDALGVAAYNMERPRPAVIASASFDLFICVMILALSLARSFIEAAHDATGLSGAGSVVWLVLNVLVAIPWWLIVLWLVLLVQGCSVWAGLLYVFRGAIKSLLDKYGPQPVVVWLPSSALPCPGQCLNLTYFSFLSSNFKDSCTCDYSKLQAAYDALDDGFKLSGVAIAGVWLMYAAGLIILVNFACQFSHTRREREYIRRLCNKMFLGI